MRRGFTLVELLAVIVILATILAITALNVSYFSTRANEREYQNLVTIIEENAKVLVNTDSSISTKIDDKLIYGNEVACKLSFDVLVDKKLMDSDTKNPKDSKVINSNSYIKVTLDSEDNYKYEFIYDSNDSLTNCLN